MDDEPSLEGTQPVTLSEKSSESGVDPFVPGYLGGIESLLPLDLSREGLYRTPTGFLEQSSRPTLLAFLYERPYGRVHSLKHFGDALFVISGSGMSVGVCYSLHLQHSQAWPYNRISAYMGLPERAIVYGLHLVEGAPLRAAYRSTQDRSVRHHSISPSWCLIDSAADISPVQ